MSVIPPAPLKFAKPCAARSKSYLAWLRLLPCWICISDVKSEAAHTGEHGLSTKAGDHRAINLCDDHHRDDLVGLDRIGRREFEQQNNVDIREHALDLINTFLSLGGEF